MSKQQTKIVICTRGKKCPKRGSEEVCEAIQRMIKKLDVGDRIGVKEAKCLDMCKKGPAVIVMPGKDKHKRMTPEDAEKLVRDLAKD